MRWLVKPWVIALVVAGITFAAYVPVGSCGFVSLDDHGYVVDQPMVNQGLRWAAVCWAFSAPHGGNWHPLTSLSHMLDCTVWGVEPGPMHWENVCWHAVNTALVFLLWQALAGRLWPAALVALLFGLHPLHVESVAWISERKDVMSTFFWLLGLLSYKRWVSRPSRLRYGLVLASLVLSLMSKPMAVTFPLTVLLLDFWPLRRWQNTPWWNLVREKIPMFGIAAISSVITLIVQRSAGAMQYGEGVGFAERAGNAVVSCVRYLGGTFWPDRLTAFYPHPGSWPFAVVLGGSGLLAVISGLALWQANRRPWLIFGWLWFLITLVPVLGFVQVGFQAMADRYTYVPLIGIFVSLAWILAAVVERWKWTRPLVAGIAAIALASCFLLTRQQIAFWTDGIALNQRMVDVSESDPMAHMYLADAMEMAGRPRSEVLAQYRKALQLDPDSVNARYEMAGVLAKDGRLVESRRLIDEARRIEPDNANVRYARGMLSDMDGQREEAIDHLTEALRLNPSHNAALRELARIYFFAGRYDEARVLLERAIASDGWDYLAYEKLALVLKAQGKLEESRRSARHALWINPSCEEAGSAL